MPRLVKDLIRHQIVAATPAAPEGSKKQWDAVTQTSYVPKTPAEVVREGFKRPPRPR
jgi:hypothetical protein